MNIHSTLKRQLRRAGLSADVLPEDLASWHTLLERVGTSYDSARQDLSLAQRSLDISSREMRELNEQLAESAETRVAAERDRLQAIISGFSDGFCNMQLDGTLSSANPAAEQILGKTPDNTDLLACFTLHKDNKSASIFPQAEILECLQAGETLRDDHALLNTPNQREIPVSVSLFPIFQNGVITNFGATFHDISERLDTERQLRRLALAVDASADAIYITNQDGVIRYVNAAFSHITGWAAADALGKTPNILKSGQTPQAIYKQLWDTLLDGEIWNDRILNKRHSVSGDASLYWAHTSITPYRDDDNRLLGFVAVQRDVTEEVDREQQQTMEASATRLRAEVAQLLQSPSALNERLHAVLRLLSESCAGIADPKRPLGLAILIDAETAEPEIVASIEQAGNAKAADLPRDAAWLEKHEPHLWKTARESDQLQIHKACHCSAHDAPSEHPHGHLILPTQHAGQTLGYLLLFTPPACEFHPAMLETYELIGEMVGLSIGEDRAREAGEKARLAAIHAAESKTRFLANMSHEIRTPMNGVLGMMDMLLQTELSSEQQEYIDIAHGSAESLLTIINDILDFSKIEAGKMHIEKIPFDLRAATEDVATLFSAPAQQKHLEIACYVPSSVPAGVLGDPTRLRQILTNIIGNAIKFTEEGEVVIRVSNVDESDTNLLLKFEISDTGIGMTEEAQRRLFTAFTQADDTTTRRFGGTGLGLAISKQLVILMGGEIGIHSQPDEGSTFWFTLPLRKQDGYQPGTEGNPGLEGERILVVDDNETNRTILSHYLRDWGVNYETAVDGFDAIDKLRQAVEIGEPYYIALLDMQMPRLDGASLARYIKADQTLAGTRLVIVSSTGLDNGNLEELGVEYSVTKPLRQSIIHDILSEMTGHRPLRPKAERSQKSELDTLHGHILLVEDNLVNQQVATGMLTRLGLSIDIAGNGQEGLEKIAQSDYDLVLMDCQMPVLDGFEATRQLRSDEQQANQPRIPVIAMTANAMSGDREVCIAAGMDDYISKPVKLSALHETLSRWLNRPESERPSPDTGSSQTMNDATPAVDMDTLDTLRDIMEDKFDLLIDAYLGEAPRLLGEIAEAIQEADSPKLRMAAHSLKSSSANLGGNGLSELARQLENLGKDEKVGEASELSAQANAEFARIQAVLKP